MRQVQGRRCQASETAHTQQSHKLDTRTCTLGAALMLHGTGQQVTSAPLCRLRRKLVVLERTALDALECVWRCSCGGVVRGGCLRLGSLAHAATARCFCRYHRSRKVCEIVEVSDVSQCSAFQRLAASPNRHRRGTGGSWNQ
jgi:hypothetical protein